MSVKEVKNELIRAEKSLELTKNRPRMEQKQEAALKELFEPCFMH